MRAVTAAPNRPDMFASTQNATHRLWVQFWLGVPMATTPNRLAVDDAGSGGVWIELAQGRSDLRIAAAIALGDGASATLGLLPRAVYLDYADSQGLLLALDPSDVVVGYALFALTVRQVRLVHLCVSPARRNHGIARRLVTWISQHHADRPGILAWCRRDYNLGPVWSALGFQRLEERPGRGRHQKVLVAWWRDHGQPSLFAATRPGVPVRASVDLNIVRDFAEPERPDRAESIALLSDQLIDRLELVRTPALDVEIDAMNDDLRGRCGREAANLTAVASPADRRREIEIEAHRVARTVDPHFAADPRSKHDVRYVSEAITAGLNIFVTRDQRLKTVLGEFAAERGLRILRPAEVFVRIDELAHAETYRPGQVQFTSVTRRLLRAGEEALIEQYGRAAGERAAELRALVRRATIEGAERVAIVDAQGEVIALYLLQLSGRVSRVPLFRVGDHELAPTVTRQVLFSLRTEAVARGATVVLLEDPHLSPATVGAAVEDGFVASSAGYAALVVDVAGDAGAVTSGAVAAADSAGLARPQSLRSDLPPLAAAEVERVWWPAKVLDSRLLSFILPIQQAYSTDLLAAPVGLFMRPVGLGLSREHVYYRSPRGAELNFPARLLWYMSASARGSVEPAGVIAVSLLEEVVVDEPVSLHERFRHLGVWRLDQIKLAATGGKAQALRFTHTERFAHTVPSPAVRALLGSVPQSPRHITGEQFQSIYEMARQHG